MLRPCWRSIARWPLTRRPPKNFSMRFRPGPPSCSSSRARNWPAPGRCCCARPIFAVGCGCCWGRATRSTAAKRVHLGAYAGGVRFRVTGSAFEQALAHWQQARALWPREYRQRMRLRPPALIKLSQANAYPRAYVTRRVGAERHLFRAHSPRAARPRRSWNHFWICSGCAAARSRFGATRRFPAAFTRR